MKGTRFPVWVAGLALALGLLNCGKKEEPEFVKQPGALPAISFQLVKAQSEPDDKLEKKQIIGGDKTIYIDPAALLTNADIRATWVPKAKDTPGFPTGPSVIISLTAEGTSKYAQITEENVGKLLVILLDGEVVSAPRIMGNIPSGILQVSGPFLSQEQAVKVAKGLVGE